MSDAVFAAYVAVQAGYILGRIRPIHRWRRASVRHLLNLRYIEDPARRERRAFPVLIELTITHPVAAWRAAWAPRKDQS